MRRFAQNAQTQGDSSMKHAGKHHFTSPVNREKLREFVQRRKINAFGLLALTMLSVIITLLGVLTGFPRTNILVFVTIMLLLLCAVQVYKLRHSFRTIRSFKGMRKRRSDSDAAQTE